MPKKLTPEQLIKCGLDKPGSAEVLRRVNPLLSLPAPECWQRIADEILIPDHPFPLHQFLHEAVFSDWDSTKGPPPAWFPSDAEIQDSNIAALMRTLKLGSYEGLHAWSAQYRYDFWKLMVERLRIRFKREFTEVVDLSNGVESPQWLVGATLNIAFFF